MALAVQLSGTMSTTLGAFANAVATYTIKAERIEQVVARDPMSAALPGGNDPLQVDLGQFIPALIISGTVDEALPTAEAGVPNKNRLETFCLSTYANTITATLIEMGASTTGANATYEGKITEFRFTKLAPSDQYWTYTITMKTKKRTENLASQ